MRAILFDFEEFKSTSKFLNSQSCMGKNGIVLFVPHLQQYANTWKTLVGRLVLVFKAFSTLLLKKQFSLASLEALLAQLDTLLNYSMS